MRMVAIPGNGNVAPVFSMVPAFGPTRNAIDLLLIITPEDIIFSQQCSDKDIKYSYI